MRIWRPSNPDWAFILLAALICPPADGADRPSTPTEAITITADFPGGNIVVDDIDASTVRLRQDERDTPQYWFYWCFEVRGAQGQTLKFVMTKGNVFGPRGPAVSLDGGGTWGWLGADSVEKDSFRYAFRPDEGNVRFAFAIPYTEKDLNAFLKQHRANTALQVEQLINTPKQRSVELLRAGRLDGKAKHRILVTCRHHACESIANFVLEGLLQAAVEETATGRWFQERCEILAVPFVDKDGVEEGDQGKLREPHDHWLDYDGNGLYAATGALCKRFKPGQDDSPVDVALDIHCPYIHDTKLYFALGSDPKIAGSTIRFCRLLEQLQRGPLVYYSRDDSAFGTGWNVAATYSGRRSFWQWAESLSKVRVVATMEVPYSSVGDVEVTPQHARALGHDLSTALRVFLDSDEE